MTLSELLKTKKVKKRIIYLRKELNREIQRTFENLISEENIVKNSIDKYYYYFRCLNLLKLSILIKRKEILENFLDRLLATMQDNMDKTEEYIKSSKYSKINISELERAEYKDAIKIMVDSLSLLYMDSLMNDESLWKE
jgi:hypothetical protein